MTVTPQTNADLERAARFLLDHDDFVVCGHMNPDGDCIGSQLGLAAALRACGKRAACVLARRDEVPANLRFLPGAADIVPAADFEGPCGAFVAVDVPSRERICDATALLDAAAASLTIDHHAAPERMTDLAHVDPDAPAAALLVWRVAGLMGAQTSEVARCCYTGVVTDTGRFQNQNTTAESLRAAADMLDAGANVVEVASEVYQSRSLAAIRLEARAVERMRFSSNGQVAMSWIDLDDLEELGARPADAETLVETLRAVAGVRVACMMRGQGEATRGSLRAVGDAEVLGLARSFGGGGHLAAAGFTVHAPVDSACEQVWEALCARWSPADQDGRRTGAVGA